MIAIESRQDVHHQLAWSTQHAGGSRGTQAVVHQVAERVSVGNAQLAREHIVVKDEIALNTQQVKNECRHKAGAILAAVAVKKH